ncbi:MAG: endonuclease/exonuclease/phosphatase family protein [Planctomycetota bacterium]
MIATLVAGCLPVWVSLAARANWVAELACHFAWQNAAAAALTLLVAFAARKKQLAGFAVLTLALCLWRVAPLCLPTGAADSGGETFRVMTLNVLSSNGRFADVLALVEREDPDLLLLVEGRDRWSEPLAPLREAYPVHLKRIRRDDFGLEFFSKLPAEWVQVQEFGGGEIPSVVAQLEFGGKPFTFVGTHPLPPISALYSQSRDDQLAAVAAFARGEPGPVVMAGDLNLSPFSPCFSDLLEGGDLRDSGRGFGFQPTWSPTWLWLGLPIDHVLHTPDFVVRTRRVSPSVGSDHRAVIVDFAFAE